MALAFRPRVRASSMMSRNGSQLLGVGGFPSEKSGVTIMAGFELAGVESVVTSAAEMAGFAVCLPGRPGRLTTMLASRR
jgi:hypothetical protein